MFENKKPEELDMNKELPLFILNQLCKFISVKQTTLTKSNEDGRVNSSINESEIIDDLKGFSYANEWFNENMKIDKPKKREWYDFSIVGKPNTKYENFFVPVNIKVSECEKGADNVSCKLGLYYALTGLLPSGNLNQWEYYFKNLRENLSTDKNKDYYFFIVNKKKREDVFFTTLKNIQSLTPNGNNLPFQCVWDVNRVLKKRTHEQAIKYLLTVFGDSITKRQEMGVSFNKYFPEYFNEGGEDNK